MCPIDQGGATPRIGRGSAERNATNIGFSQWIAIAPFQRTEGTMQSPDCSLVRVGELGWGTLGQMVATAARHTAGRHHPPASRAPPSSGDGPLDRPPGAQHRGDHRPILRTGDPPGPAALARPGQTVGTSSPYPSPSVAYSTAFVVPTGDRKRGGGVRWPAGGLAIASRPPKRLAPLLRTDPRRGWCS